MHEIDLETTPSRLWTLDAEHGTEHASDARGNAPKADRTVTDERTFASVRRG